MKSQGELEKIPVNIEKAFNELSERVMKDMVERLKENGFSGATADYEYNRLKILGMADEQIRKYVKETMNLTEDELNKIYSEDAYEEYYGFKRAYDASGVEQIPYGDNAELQQLVEAVRQQTLEECNNLTQSMGFATKDPVTGRLNYSKIGEFYRNTLDDAMYDITTGSFSYNEVLKKTINKMTMSGLRHIDYESGVHNRVPVAARRAVMTGFRQVQGKINEQVARELKTDYYEVSFHVGARPTHQVWQGKVYSMEQLINICGLGSVTGLHGANCYHDYNAFVPGISTRAYTDEWLQEMADKENEPTEYNGRSYTTYEALQQQRKMETLMRKYREDIELMKLGEADEFDITLKKCRYEGTMQEYKRFSEKMKLPEQMDRVYMDGLKGNYLPGKREKEKIKNKSND